MEAIRRQASKLGEQVAKQQQALMKQLVHFDAQAIMTDEEELKCHQQLQNLYRSTRKCNEAGDKFFVSVVRKLAEDCCKYGTKEQYPTSPLAEVAFQVGTSHNLVKEREILLHIFSDKVCEPLRALVGDSQLEDARLLVRQYESLWQEVENQAVEVARQKWRSRDGATSENSLKLQIAEAKLNDLKFRLMTCGKETIAAMSSVETRQQKRAADYLLAMVEAERSYNQNFLMILDILLEEAVHPFDAIEEGELSLTVDD